MNVNEIKHQAKLQEWHDNILDCRSSGIAVSRWCAEHHVHPTTYYKWERELFDGMGKEIVMSEQKAIAAPLFAELPSSKNVANSQSNPMIMATIHLGTVSIDVYPNVDTNTLVSLLQILKSC